MGAARAEYALDDLDTKDFGTFDNDIRHGPFVPVTVSFEVQWSGKKREFQLRDATNVFRGEFVETGATLEWSAREATLHFESDPANTSTSVFAALGQERNGVFF